MVKRSGDIVVKKWQILIKSDSECLSGMQSGKRDVQRASVGFKVTERD